ncbi:CPCC family cysteine-rich protein [Sphingomonas sp. Sphisp140]|uniref:CPCC family cysteine-rich protein n=1 Tax=unclassified Sphingomonas TaxID=196159 RepID=UPI0039B0BB78
MCERTEMEDGDYVVCPVCGWENDPVQLADGDYAGGANHMSLNEARRQWHATGKRVQ